MNYLYDGSYGGFLTCVYKHYYGERADGIFRAEEYRQLDLLRYALTVETEERLASRVHDAITDKISKWDAERAYRVFCTNESEKEMKLLRYLQLGFKHGPKIRLLHGNPVVKDVEAADQRLGMEVHRYTGLIRFSELEGGVLYSPITPDNDVLEFLAPHFSDRYRYDPFVIRDKTRGKALFAFDKKWRIEPVSEEIGQIVSAGEKGIRDLWKQYFDVMATKERVNPKLQRQFVPTRYRKHLPEFGP